jgi:hypothetical protein
LDDEERRMKFSRSAKTAAEMYDWPNVVGLYRQAYSDAVVSS